MKIHGRTAKAIEEAIRICRDENVLRKYLEEREVEVKTIMSMLFSQKDVMERYGKAQMEKGIITSIKTLMKSMNLSLEKAMDALQISGDDRKKYAELMGV